MIFSDLASEGHEKKFSEAVYKLKKAEERRQKEFLTTYKMPKLGEFCTKLAIACHRNTQF